MVPIGEDAAEEGMKPLEDIRIRLYNPAPRTLLILDKPDDTCENGLLTCDLASARKLRDLLTKILDDPTRCLDCDGTAKDADGKPCYWCRGKGKRFA